MVAPSRSARSRAWPFLPLAPAVVVVLAALVAVAIGAFGVGHLRRVSDEHAASQAEALAGTLAARLGQLSTGDRLEAMQLAARRTGAEFLVVSEAGDVLHDASLGALDRRALRRAVERRRGEAVTALGRTRFAVHSVTAVAGAAEAATDPMLVAFVRMPPTPEGGPALIKALLALTTLLVGTAATVAFAMARDAARDVAFVTRRVEGMVQIRSEPTGEAVPVRTMDEVGVLTSAFNELVGRFAAAERTYRQDLDRVRAADQDRAAFLAAVSHELRTPLNAILGFADILMAEVDGPLSPSAREEVEQVRASGQHLLELINDILELSALEGGQLTLSRDRVDLATLVGGILREASALVAGKPLALRVEVLENAVAYADPKRVRQVLTNLVSNAVKFTQAGAVVVSVSRQGAYARVSVSDTGPGISAQERAFLFQEYKQAEGERKRRRGTGLGLAIARRLVMMHGGTIQVESELGKGSTFHVMLPIYFERDGRRGRRLSRHYA